MEKSRIDRVHGRLGAENHAVHPVRGYRQGFGLFYVGPNNRIARELAHCSESLPLFVCYFWSAELLNAVPLGRFAVGLVMEDEWQRILCLANERVRTLLGKIPIFILARSPAVALPQAPFPTAVAGAFAGDSDLRELMGRVMAAVDDSDEHEHALGYSHP